MLVYVTSFPTLAFELRVRSKVSCTVRLSLGLFRTASHWFAFMLYWCALVALDCAVVLGVLLWFDVLEKMQWLHLSSMEAYLHDECVHLYAQTYTPTHVRI